MGCGGADWVGSRVGDWDAVGSVEGDSTAVIVKLASPLKVAREDSDGEALAEVGILAEGPPLAAAEGDAKAVAVPVAGKETERVGGEVGEKSTEAPGEVEPAAVCVKLWSLLCDGVMSLLAGPLWEATGETRGLCDSAPDAAADPLPGALPDCNGAGVVVKVAPPENVGYWVDEGSPPAAWELEAIGDNGSGVAEWVTPRPCEDRGGIDANSEA